MPSAVLQPCVTPDAYLLLERKADCKSEYLNGQIIAMAGASRHHNLIAGNLYREISRQLQGRPCEAYISDMRVKVSPTGLYTYPDIVAVCDEIRFEDANNDTLLNPLLIVEVLSPSTEAYDRGEKFAHYRRLSSLQEYLLVSQDKVRIEHYTRQGAHWILTEIANPQSPIANFNATVYLPSIGCDVALDAIYDKVWQLSGDETIFAG